MKVKVVRASSNLVANTFYIYVSEIDPLEWWANVFPLADRIESAGTVYNVTEVRTLNTRKRRLTLRTTNKEITPGEIEKWVQSEWEIIKQLGK